MVVPRVCAGDVLSLGHRKCLSFEFPDHHSTPAQQRAACHSRQQFVGLLPSCDSHATMLSDPFSSSNGMLAKPLVKPERLLERSAVSTKPASCVNAHHPPHPSPYLGSSGDMRSEKVASKNGSPLKQEMLLQDRMLPATLFRFVLSLPWPLLRCSPQADSAYRIDKQTRRFSFYGLIGYHMLCACVLIHHLQL
jgi:hypothetical protein